MARNLMDILNDAQKAMELHTQKAFKGPPREAYTTRTELEGHRCTSDCRRIGCEDVEARQRRAEMIADDYAPAHTDCMSTSCPACAAEYERVKSEQQKERERLDAKRIEGMFY